MANEWQSFRRVGEVRAERLNHEWRWTTDNGDEMIGRPGDWAVTDETGHERSVTDEAFTGSHAEIAPGRYRRSGIYRARRVAVEEDVETDEGRAVAYPGDWILEGSLGERWPVPGEQFAQKYEGPIDDAVEVSVQE